MPFAGTWISCYYGQLFALASDVLFYLQGWPRHKDQGGRYSSAVLEARLALSDLFLSTAFRSFLGWTWMLDSLDGHSGQCWMPQ